MIGKKFLAFSLSAVILAGSAMSASAAGVKDVFDANTYAGQYSDLKAAYGTDAAKLLEHFKAFGAKEGRVASPILDVVAYRNAYSDLNAVYGDNWDAYVDHYLTIGIKEKRTAGVLFDLVDYANKNADVKAAFGEDYAAIAQHYINYGIKEGRPGGTIATAAPAASSNSGSSSSSNNTTQASVAQAPATQTPASQTVAHKHTMDKSQTYANESGTIVVTYNPIVDKLDPSCDKPGWEKRQCTELVDVIVDGVVVQQVRCSHTETTPLTAKHTMPSKAVWSVCADCVNPGEVHYVCTVCGTYQEEIVKALGHEYDKTKPIAGKSKSSTCTTQGEDWYKCIRCDQEICEKRALEPHKIAEWITTKDPTCYSEGERKAFCSLCGDPFTEKVARTNHTLKTETIHVDAYTDNVSGIPMHTNQSVTYCTVKECRYVTAAGNVETKECTGGSDGKCTVCHLDMNRGKANSVKVYKVGEKFDINIIQ